MTRGHHSWYLQRAARCNHDARALSTCALDSGGGRSVRALLRWWRCRAQRKKRGWSESQTQCPRTPSWIESQRRPLSSWGPSSRQCQMQAQPRQSRRARLPPARWGRGAAPGWMGGSAAAAAAQRVRAACRPTGLHGDGRRVSVGRQRERLWHHVAPRARAHVSQGDRAGGQRRAVVEVEACVCVSGGEGGWRNRRYRAPPPPSAHQLGRHPPLVPLTHPRWRPGPVPCRGRAGGGGGQRAAGGTLALPPPPPTLPPCWQQGCGGAGRGRGRVGGGGGGRRGGRRDGAAGAGERSAACERFAPTWDCRAGTALPPRNHNPGKQLNCPRWLGALHGSQQANDMQGRA